MRKLLIADSNEDFRLALESELCKHFRVLCCGRGDEALETVLRELPEVLVLDVRLPELDGLTLLERMHQAGVHPKVMLFSPLLSHYELNILQHLGISYMMRKPCELFSTVARILDLADAPAAQKPDPHTFVTEVLLSMPFCTKHNGFAYLQEALPRMLQDPSQSITKELYPAVAKHFGRHSRHVERGIRTALDRAWQDPSHPVLQKYFPGTTSRPSNGDFLARMAELLRRELE